MRGPHSGRREQFMAGPWAEWGDPRGGGRGWGDRRRMRRGDVRGEVLSALVDGPAHGYEVIRRLEERSGGRWRPSPGSIYPTLQMLEDAGLVRASEQDGRRTYTLTEDGRSEAEQHAAQTPADWSDDDPANRDRLELQQAVHQLHLAARQVAGAANPDQVGRATTAVRQARQTLYQILAED